MRKIKDAVDLSTDEKIYFRGHAKVTYLSDGRNIEDAMSNLATTEWVEGKKYVNESFVKGAIAEAQLEGSEIEIPVKDVRVDNSTVVDENGIAKIDLKDYVKSSSLANVATSGSYNDLSNKPTIPDSVTSETISGWGFTKNTGTYSKPTDGIPKSDLATDVQTSLEKATSAVQSSDLATVATSGSYNDLSDKPNPPAIITESTVSGWGFTKNTGTYSKPATGIPTSDLSEDVQSSLSKANSALQSHQSLDGKQDKLVSEVNIKTINGESILGPGNIVIERGNNVSSDWEAKDGTSGYVNNRTHYIENLLSIDTSNYEFVFNNDEDAFSNSKYIGKIEDISDIYIYYKSDHYLNNEGVVCNFIKPNNSTETYYSYSIIGIGNIQLAYCKGRLDMKISRGTGNFSFNIGKIFKLNENFIPDNAKQKMINTTWQNLKNLRDSGSLIPGMQYRITDYETTTAQAWTRSAGHQFDIIVTADSENTLNEKARAIQHEGDTHFNRANLTNWEIWYCLDNDENRFEWISDEDKVVNRVKLNNNGELVLLEQSGTTSEDDKLFYSWKGTNNETTFYIYSDVLDVTPESIVYISSTTGIKENTNGWTFIVESENISKGKGVIYRMIDEYGNDCPYDFKNIQFLRSFENSFPMLWKYGWKNVEKNSRYLYTFSRYPDIADLTILTPGSVTNNKINKYKKLNNIVFMRGFTNYNGESGYGFYYNNFEENCRDITVLAYGNHNNFGSECFDIVFGGQENKFGHNVSDILFEHTCVSNILNNNILKIQFNGKYKNNKFLLEENYIGHVCNSDNPDKYVQKYIVFDCSTIHTFTTELPDQTICNSNFQFNIENIKDSINAIVSESVMNVLNTEV